MSSATGPLSSRTDEQLGRAALAGDREAFTELFGRHEAGLQNVAFRLTGSREDAADISQEAFLRVFARLDDLAGREVNLAAYLHRTARNLVYDRGARSAREAPTGEAERLAGADEALEADPELNALVGAQGRDVQAANARLPERHRLALALRELQDMGYDDIGRVLDITPGAVAQLLSRARLGLRRELRLEQVDAAALAPACRARLGDIGALIDGELHPDRAQVLVAHMAACGDCRAARAAFDEARVTYRAWLPFPALGLGAATARAAQDRGLVAFGDRAAAGGGEGSAGAGGASAAAGSSSASGAPPAPGDERRRRRRRAAAMVGAGILALLLLVGVPTLVAVRSGSSEPAAVPAQATTPAPATAPAAAAPPTTTAAPAPAPAGTTAAPPAAAVQAPPPAASPPAAAPAPPAPTTSAARRRPPRDPSVARPPAPAPPPAAPPPVTEPPPAPEPEPPVVTDPPPPRPPTTSDPTFTTPPPRPRPPIIRQPPGTPPVP